VYLPGYKISENELCKQYGVSRHIIRTAISRLKERTLLTVYPQRGTFVSLIDMKAVELILFIRESVEQEATRLLQFESQEVRERMGKAMKDCIERQRAAISENIDMDAFYALDNEFHGCLLDAVGKKDVMEIIREDYIHFRRWRNFDVVRTGRQAEIIKEHTDECADEESDERSPRDPASALKHHEPSALHSRKGGTGIFYLPLKIDKGPK